MTATKREIKIKCIKSPSHLIHKQVHVIFRDEFGDIDRQRCWEYDQKQTPDGTKYIRIKGKTVLLSEIKDWRKVSFRGSKGLRFL